jgi:hypothetical protein
MILFLNSVLFFINHRDGRIGHWVMKTFFLKEEQAQTAAGGLYVSTEVVDSSELVLPAYEGVAPVEVFLVLRISHRCP